MKITVYFINAAIIFLAGCSSVKETSQEIQGLPYDPPGSTVTTNKTTYPQHKRTFQFSDDKLFVSNEFTGSRLNDFYKENDSTFIAVIEPENAPINNSAWYCFKIWSDVEKKVNLKIIYKDGSQRYIPKLSKDGIHWKPIGPTKYFNDTAQGVGNLKLSVGMDELWVSAQELVLSKDYEEWLNKLSSKSFIRKSEIGRSVEKRAINKIEITDAGENVDLVFIIGRQHPPEVTGAFALMSFVEKLADNSELSKKFRKKFKTVIIPIVNPDGVDNGNWRHNVNGIDLNRDWLNFNQPETHLVKEELLKTVNEFNNKVKFFIDFHSTQQDVFYITSEDSTVDVDPIFKTTKAWLERIQQLNPDYVVNVDESLNSYNAPTSESWAYNTFKAPALTYELGDETERELIMKVCSSAAEAMMEVLLNEEK